MKKTALLLIIFLSLAAAKASAVDVSSFSYLKQLFQANTAGTQNARLIADINFNSNLGSAGTALDLTIDGQNTYALVGNLNNFVIGLGNDLTFKNLNVQNFIGNGVVTSNGAIVKTEGNVTFKDNYKEFADGGVLNLTNSTFIANGKVTFSSNTLYTAAIDGGAIYAKDSNLTFYDEAYFYGNKGYQGAQGAVWGSVGGAIIYSNTNYAPRTVVFSSKTVFLGNEASVGGAIWLDGAYLSSTFNFLGETIFENNKAVNGFGAAFAGAFCITGANVNFEDNAKFLNNSALGYAGAIASVFSDITFKKDTIFTGNTAGQEGGAIQAGLMSNTYFKGYTEFSYNISSSSGGAVSLAFGANMYFSSYTYFNANKANYGGAISLYGDPGIALAYASFESSTVFTSNIATTAGGAIYSESSNTDFKNSTFTFINNRAAGYGGALAIENKSLVAFSNSNIIFENNNAEKGGALALTDSGVNFTGSDVDFSNNKATFNTGGAALAVGSILNFVNSNVNFNDNESAFSGGAMQIQNLSSIASEVYFANSTATFSGNIASSNGGALFVNDINFNTDIILEFSDSYVSFTSNTAQSGSGGAIAVIDNNAKITFLGNPVSFIGNTAGSDGGAVYAGYGSSFEFDNASFIDNKSVKGVGGAVALFGASPVQLATVTFNTSVMGANSQTIFQGNTANGKSNALFLGDYSRAIFNIAANSSVEMYDGIMSSANNAKITISGSGDFNFYGDGSKNYSDIEVSLTGGGALNLKNGAVLNAGTFTNNAGAVLNMNDNAVNSMSVFEFNNAGTINMETFDDVSDSITSSGAVDLNAASSILNVNVKNGSTERKAYMLFKYDVLTGTFSAVNPSGLYSGFYYSLGSGANDMISVIINGGANPFQTEFSRLSGLTFNQKEVARVYDVLSGTRSGDLGTVITAIDVLSKDGQKAALGQASGYFLANVLRSAALDSYNNDIYDRIKNHCHLGRTSDGIWIQAIGGLTSYGGDENSINEFKDTSFGAMAGYDRYSDDTNIVWGIFGKFKNHDITQDPNNSATVTNSGAGFYIGYIQEKYEIKGLISGSYDQYETERYMSFMNRKAKADFTGMTFGADVEGALKYELNENLNFRPYAGVEVRNTMADKFKEKGADSLNLEVENANYLRGLGRGGLGLVYDDKRYSFYVNGEAKFLFSGTKPEIESKFEGTNIAFKSAGYEEDGFIYGAGLGGAIRVYEGLKIFINGNYYGAKDFENIQGNLGFRYTFCSNKLSKKEKAELASKEAEETRLAAEEEARRVAEEERRVAEEARLAEEARIKAEEEARIAAEIAERERLEREAAELAERRKPKTDSQARAEAKERREKPTLKAFNLSMGNFASGKATLTAKAKQNIKEIASEIKEFNYKFITVEGHTDSTGKASTNQALSKARAKAVYDVLVQEGIPAERVIYIGFGSTMPVATNKTNAGKAKNRRVEIYVE